jgi:hypothetical protein
MEIITKDYQWYTDTPEQPFEYSEGSIWLINPKTEEWMLELEKPGVLWYQYETSDIFSKYLNMEISDFESFIKMWMEDALKRGVVSIIRNEINWDEEVKDVLEKGIITTYRHDYMVLDRVKDAVENGSVTTVKLGEWSQVGVGDVIKRGQETNPFLIECEVLSVKDALKNGNTIKNQEI